MNYTVKRKQITQLVTEIDRITGNVRSEMFKLKRGGRLTKETKNMRESVIFGLNKKRDELLMALETLDKYFE